MEDSVCLQAPQLNRRLAHKRKDWHAAQPYPVQISETVSVIQPHTALVNLCKSNELATSNAESVEEINTLETTQLLTLGQGSTQKE